MNNTEKEFAALIASADGDTLKFIGDALQCYFKHGEKFMNEIADFVARRDAEGIKKAVARGLQG